MIVPYENYRSNVILILPYLCGEKYIFLCLLYCYIKIKNVSMFDSWNSQKCQVSHEMVNELEFFVDCDSLLDFSFLLTLFNFYSVSLNSHVKVHLSSNQDSSGPVYLYSLY